MATREYNGVFFEPPSEWQDRTIVAFATPTSDPTAKSAPNFVMTQEPMREGDTLRMHADRVLTELARQLQDFEILESEEVTIGGQPANHIRYTWTASFGALNQEMFVIERSVGSGHIATIFTSTSRREEAEATRAVMAGVIKSVHFGETPAPPHVPTPTASQPLLDTRTPEVPMPGAKPRDRQ
jgi:hypothetical protein